MLLKGRPGDPTPTLPVWESGRPDSKKVRELYGQFSCSGSLGVLGVRTVCVRTWESVASKAKRWR